MGPPRERDEDWFTRVYETNYEPVVKYGKRRLTDVEAAAELAQEVFVIAWRRRREVPDRSLPWLYGVARRLLANEWRARRAAPDVLPMTDAGLVREPASHGADTTVGVADLRAALATLPGLDQEILRLVGWEELTVSEAAKVLGCSRNTAAVRLHRARRRLDEAMSNHSGSPVRQPVLASTRKAV